MKFITLDEVYNIWYEWNKGYYNQKTPKYLCLALWNLEISTGTNMVSYYGEKGIDCKNNFGIFCEFMKKLRYRIV